MRSSCRYFFTILLLLASGCTNLQKEVRNAGYIPLADLDLIQIVPPEGGRVYSDQVVIGSIYPWPVDKNEHLVGGVLHPVPNPTRPTYAFTVALSKGPDEVLQTANADASLTANKINLGSWAKVNFDASATAKSQIKLNKIWQGAIKTDVDDLVPLFIAADPPRDSPAQREYLWVTGFLAADVDNSDEIGVRVKADAQLNVPGSTTTKPTTYPVSINAGADAKSDVKGPGLLLGLKGQVLSTQFIGTIAETPLPTVAQGKLTVPIKLLDGTVAQLLILRRKPDDVRLDITSATNTTVYVKDINDEWKKDVPKASEPAKLPVPEIVPMAIFGDNLTRAIVVERRGFGDETTVYSIVVYPSQRGRDYLLAGAVYRVKLKPAEVQ
jgi:hypothetical protein